MVHCDHKHSISQVLLRVCAQPWVAQGISGVMLIYSSNSLFTEMSC